MSRTRVRSEDLFCARCAKAVRLSAAHWPEGYLCAGCYTHALETYQQCAGCSFDGHTLATGSADTAARLWDVSDSRHHSPLGTLTGHTDSVHSVAFSPDGHTLATASYDTTTQLWDVTDPRHPRPLGTLTGHTNGVRSVAFNPDGHTLATASYDNTAQLWDVSDLGHPNPLGTLTGHTNGVRSVAFSPDGHTLATTSPDTTGRLWETNIESVAARICSITPTITKSEWNHYLPDLPYQPPCP